SAPDPDGDCRRRRRAGSRHRGGGAHAVAGRERTVTAQVLPYVGRRTGRPSGTRIGWIALFAGAVLLYVLFAGSAPQETHQDSALFLWINDVRAWVRDTPI